MQFTGRASWEKRFRSRDFLFNRRLQREILEQRDRKDLREGILVFT